MKHDCDTLPMTPEKAIKLKAHEYLMRMKNAGVPWAYVTNAAVVMVLELKVQYFRNTSRTEQEKKIAAERFEQLEKAIISYLPKAKEGKAAPKIDA